jgi:hypothetical protein
VLYIDDKLASHPKIFRAGSLLGPNGGAQVFALYVAGIGYAREHLTDGFIPDTFVQACGLVQRPQAVARALTSRGVSLWHRVRGGYRIHDYFDWNPKASAVKKKRAKWREKKARQRRGSNGEYSGESQGDNEMSPRDAHRDSRAPVPRSMYVLGTTGHDRTVPVLVPPNVQTGRCASGLHGKTRKCA